MKKNSIAALLALVFCAAPAAAQKKYGEIRPDTAKVKFVRCADRTDAYIFDRSLTKNVVYVNEEVTTHIIMPENIRLVDISTDKIVGNQCADNIVRIKPAARLYDNELAGTVTVIGERHLAQYDVVYTPNPAKAFPVHSISHDEMRRYTNPDVLMSESRMADFAWSIYCSGRKYYNIHSRHYGITASVNNIYAVNDYFFIDFSLQNSTGIKYDIDEIRVKLTDKKEAKATNSQTVELTPVFSLNRAASFSKGYRNVIVVDKLTFPDEKVLRLEIAEKQISGRVVYINIEYDDVLNADSFDKSLLGRRPFTLNQSR